MLIRLFAADIGLINLNNLVLAAERAFRLRLAKALTDAMAKEPSCLLGKDKKATENKCECRRGELVLIRLRTEGAIMCVGY